ncbi:hypothetical protein GCM10009785_19960 [Brooklawnia cerclae]|uniref:Integrase n=1 Tax=Brooklawnia cerclae TaxID=349934 RepID=A0ABX0SKK7_9ACTN|nr:site-specific integrase [Brooklawnia cerclae]NIH57262.1 integrase [Brooklawnia cerclae]
MAIDDLWTRKDGTPTKRHGRGMRYRVRVEGYRDTSHRTYREAEYVNARRIADGPPTPKSSDTVGDMIDLWLESKRSLAPKSVEAARDAARAVRSRWGSMLVADVEQSAVQAWLNAETGSPSRLHKLSQCLGGAMAIAVRRKSIETSPCVDLTTPAEEPHEPVYLTREQVGAIASNCHGWGRDRRADKRLDGWYAPMIWFMATTAARIGEVVALDVGSVVRRKVKGKDVWRARIVVSKSERPRDVPVPAKVVAMLNLDRPKTDPLFVTPLGHRIRKDTFRARAWTKALKASGMDDSELRIHDLRHTAISWAIADGADVKAVQRMAGHKSATTTLDVYGHLWDSGLDAVSDRMNRRVLKG